MLTGYYLFLGEYFSDISENTSSTKGSASYYILFNY